MRFTKIENFILSKIAVETDIDKCHFYMPTNNCFTYFINELCIVIKNNESGQVKNNYVIELCKAFYKFLDNDKVLKNVDSLSFANVYLLVKAISEGRNDKNIKITLDILYSAKRRCSNQYLNKIISKLKELNNANADIDDDLSYLVELFLNELLARNFDIRFINQITNQFIKKQIFETLDDYFSFFSEDGEATTDVFLPISNCTEENRTTIEESDQKVVEKDGKLFLHVYSTKLNDYYFLIKTNMTRIDSIFNMLKFYTATRICFDTETNIEIELQNKFLKEKVLKLEVKLDKITKYRGSYPYAKHFDQTLKNLKTISENDSDLYHKILNIIGYAEKDNDIISSSSYVDAWIALESLYSLPKIGDQGYESVKNMLPKIISSRIIVSRITFLLKESFTIEKMKMEDFVKKACNDEKLKMTSSNPFYCHELNNIYKCVSSINELSKLYEKIESEIQLNLLRIYMLRNQYVHESKLSAFSSLDFYKLKNFLTYSLDTFFSIVNQKIEYIDEFDNLALSVYSSLIRKNDNRSLLFKLNKEYVKCCQNGERIVIRELNDGFELSELILNVLLNNKHLLEKYKPYKSKRPRKNIIEKFELN